MEALKPTAWRQVAACGVLMLAACFPHDACPIAPDLYAQATRTMLDRDFPSERIEYLLLDAKSGQTIAVRWSHPEQGIPAGSLLKPFVALAYSQAQAGTAHPARFPTIQCHGKADGCWHAAGHGALTLEPALAVSCNAYFLALGRQILAAAPAGREALDSVSVRYGLPEPPAHATPSTLIGLTPDWRIPPLALARAYAALATQTTSGSPVATQLLGGMRRAAQPGGTAARLAPLGRSIGPVLAKTGTAPCIPGSDSWSDRCIANGDGLTVVVLPAVSPRLLLLVRQHGTTGAETAEVASRMLLRITAQERTHASH